MFQPAVSVPWTGSLVWLAGFLIAGFAVAWLLTDRGRMPLTPYVGALTLLTGGLAAGYTMWTGSGTALWANRWTWGVVAAVLCGGLLAVAVNRARGVDLDPRPVTGVRVLWEALVYGSTEGLLLSVLPVAATWQAFAAAGWSAGGLGVVAALCALAASVAMIVVHHLGYVGYRGRRLVLPVIACLGLSVMFLLTGSPIAAIGGHVLLHGGILRRGAQMPPHPLAHTEAATATA